MIIHTQLFDPHAPSIVISIPITPVQFLPSESKLLLHSSRLVVVLRVEDPQDGEEQVDDVEVEGDGRRNLLLNVVVAHDHLCVHEDVAREDERADNTVT